ncbi:ACP S-malonyltransferase [Seleniivibrio woodruffii]|uniref:Malonyl CoA-acyl carrier protein transacylase n=1 Tax=Seleniivibrio woodruffii TaxID=1078050 RepID=A0A4R1KAW4_9BACT|nr:ACP S-malonyltransferase [Seleniivibrio woodruffii]TCK61616.1 [acyl-carrier-protein] S-malonyltransferase [Seleniivibrio woodruffii]TVZ35269.1 [Acyl-carrier-protein] S-malonyltransferase [Seleniivibrio woodruffii]
MGKTAVVFPGQGSQFVGMGKDFYDACPEVKAIFDKADAALGYSLTKIMFEGSEDELKTTYNTQPALLTMSIGIWEVLRNRVKADYFAGHSLGEYSAVVAAGGFTFEEGVLAVHNRGKFMQDAVPVGVGAMAAVMGIDDEIVVETCKEVSGAKVVEPANFNCPGQIVVAGHKEAVEEFSEKIKAKGAKRALLLPVSAPFHCSLMKPARDRMAEYLKNNIVIKDLNVPVFNNVDAKEETSAADVYDALCRQVDGAVLWTSLIKNMVDSGVDRFIEVGAGQVLAGLIKKIDKNVTVENISKFTDLPE